MVEVKDVDLPIEMQRAMAKQAEAEREKRAKIIHAAGEFEAAKQLSEAADDHRPRAGDAAAALPADADRDRDREELDDHLPAADGPHQRLPQEGQGLMAGLGLDDRPEEAPDKAAPVHYQISITGRQAGFFFLLLLAALGLSFFFGMKTGAAARKGPGGAAAVIASASDIPVPTLAPAEGLREAKKPDDTLGIKPEEKKAAEAVDGRSPRRRRPSRRRRRRRRRPPAPVPTPKPAAAAKPAPKGPFYVQILATKNAAAADELAKRLKDEGFNADVATIAGKPGWFRVHVGPFKDRAKAEALAKKIKATDKQIKNVPLVVP